MNPTEERGGAVSRSMHVCCNSLTVVAVLVETCCGCASQSKNSKCKSPTVWLDLGFAELPSNPFVGGGRLRL